MSQADPFDPFNQQPDCNPHPKAPHGFLRNASHTEDRYVCECENWDPYEAGYLAGMQAALKLQGCPHGVTDGNCKECYEEKTGMTLMPRPEWPPLWVGCPNCESLQAQNTELDRALGERERQAVAWRFRASESSVWRVTDDGAMVQAMRDRWEIRPLVEL